MKYLILLIAIAMTAACSSVDNIDYKNAKPALTMEHFFNGSLTAHGIVKDRSGKVIRTFNATIDAHWNGDVGVLDESFIFDDGEKQKRVWRIKKSDSGEYTATAGDVVGDANLKVSGNSLFLKYILQIPYKGRQLDIKVDDRMYLINQNVLLNESLLYKWGFKVGSINLVILKD